MDNNDSFSNMHAAWNANGAHEFIPSSGFKAPDFGYQPRHRQEYDPRGYQHHMNQYHMTSAYSPAVGAYPTQSYWPHLLPVPNPWQRAPEMGMGAMTAQKSAGTPFIQESKFLVALWNLKPAYGKEDIKEALEEMDITPVRVRMCLETPGTCLLWCVEEWTANAVAMMLDMTDDILQVDEGKPIRAVKCPSDVSKLLTPDMPFPLRQALIQETRGDA